MTGRKRKRPKLDETIERDEALADDIIDAFKMMFQDTPDRPRSENREPTKAELNRRWKLERR